MRRHLAPLLAVLALLAGCGDDGDETDAGAATTDPAENPVVGRTYESTEVTGDAAPTLVDPIRITFGEDDEITIDAGCNPITASYEIEGPILVVTDQTRAEVGCLPALIPQDTWVTEAFTLRLAFTPAPPTGLVISTKDWTMDMVAVDDEDGILGPTWMLDTIIDGDTTRSVPSGFEASIHFGPDGAFQVTGGCNGGNGTYTPPGGGETIQIESLSLTRQRCDAEAEDLDATMVTTLDGTIRVAVDGDRLTLTNEDGAGLSFTADG